jgi:hypothetical protein
LAGKIKIYLAGPQQELKAFQLKNGLRFLARKFGFS